MRTIPNTILFLLWLPFHVCGQGYLAFDNISGEPGPAPVTISTALGTSNPANGPAGAYLGSDYTASLYFLNGSVSSQALFDISNPSLVPSANTLFYGTTGTGPNHGPGIDDAGLFEGYQVYIGAAAGQIVTVQVRAWYNGNGLYTSYDQALAAGQNVGESNLVPLTLSVGLSLPPNLDGLLPFTVGIVPEPPTLALIGLGGLSFWLFGRKYARSVVPRLRGCGLHHLASSEF
jgi:hypothetical protein